MAGLTIGSRINSVFPDGTVVQARPEARAAVHGRYHGKGGADASHPAGPAAQASATVTAGVLTLTGLDPSTPYVLTGVVGGELRMLRAFSEAS